MSRVFGITYFGRLYDNKGQFFEISLEELKALATREYNVEYKDRAPGTIYGKLEKDSKEQGTNVLYRSCLAVDFDHIKSLNDWYDNFNELFSKYTYIMYTSFSHSDLEGKIRVIIPLKKDVPAGQYEDFINNIFCYSLNKSIASSVDKTTFQAKRFMFCHSSPIGKKGFSYFNEGEDLLDISWYPYGTHANSKVEDKDYKEIQILYPTYKEAIEYFNTKYQGNAIYSAIKDEEYIDIFNSIDMMWFIQTKLTKVYPEKYKNRFKYVRSSSGMCGAIVYDNMLYSNHDSDPACNGHTHSNFSLLKIHLCDGSYVAAINHIKRLLNYKFYE